MELGLAIGWSVTIVKQNFELPLTYAQTMYDHVVSHYFIVICFSRDQNVLDEISSIPKNWEETVMCNSTFVTVEFLSYISLFDSLYVTCKYCQYLQKL